TPLHNTPIRHVLNHTSLSLTSRECLGMDDAFKSRRVRTGDPGMPGKRLVSGIALLAALSSGGCCTWCRRHCGMETAAYPAPTCCVPVCCPAPAAQPMACQPATTYSAPQGAPGYPAQTQWQRSYAAPACTCN